MGASQAIDDSNDRYFNPHQYVTDTISLKEVQNIRTLFMKLPVEIEELDGSQFVRLKHLQAFPFISVDDLQGLINSHQNHMKLNQIDSSRDPSYGINCMCSQNPNPSTMITYSSHGRYEKPIQKRGINKQNNNFNGRVTPNSQNYQNQQYQEDQSLIQQQNSFINVPQQEQQLISEDELLYNAEGQAIEVPCENCTINFDQFFALVHSKAQFMGGIDFEQNETDVSCLFMPMWFNTSAAKVPKPQPVQGF